MAEDEQVDLSLADVLRALKAEIRRADDDPGRGTRVESATVDLDVAIEATGDGTAAFWVSRVQGGTKRGKTTQLSVTLRASDVGAELEVAGSGQADDERRETSAVEGEVAPPEPRPLGLVDVLADALKTLAQSTSAPGGGGQRPRPGSPGGGDGTQGGSR